MRPHFDIRCSGITKEPADPWMKHCGSRCPMMKEMLTAMGVCIVEMEGYEADDLLGTIAGMGEREGMEVSVVSGDRDLLQLVNRACKDTDSENEKDRNGDRGLLRRRCQGTVSGFPERVY